MTAFWEGVFAGYGIAIPVGAIAIHIVDMGLRRGFWAGFMAGAGAATADFVYALLAVIAGQTLARALGRDAGTTVTTHDRLLFVFGAALASLSWQTSLAGLGALANQHLSPRFQLIISVVGNLVVIALGMRSVCQLL